jgi:hypothetical protein
MSESNDLKGLIFTKSLHIPIIRKELADSFWKQLNEIYPPIDYDFFYVQSWNCHETRNWIDFTLNTKCCFIKRKLGFQNPTHMAYNKFSEEYHKDLKKVLDTLPTIVHNGDLFNIHIDILADDEFGCDIKLTCYPFLYHNKVTFRNQIDDLREQSALIYFHDNLQRLIIGLNAKDKSDFELSLFSEFLGINQDWMISTCALQLQEVSITLVAKKKGIILDKTNVERILKRQINKDEHFFSCQYEAFVREAKRLYGFEIPSMAMWLRKMRQAVLHEGQPPTEQEKELAVLATVSLLKELRKVNDAKEIVSNDSATTS